MKKLFLLLFSVLAFTSQVRAGEYVVYQPEDVEHISGANQPSIKFPCIKANDVIKIHYTNVSEDCKIVWRGKHEGDWKWVEIGTGSNGILSYTVPNTNQTYGGESYTSDEIVASLKERGLTLTGTFNLLAVTVIDNNNQLINTSKDLITEDIDLGNWETEVSLASYDFSSTRISDVINITYTTYSEMAGDAWAGIQLQSKTTYDKITDKCSSQSTQSENEQQTLSIIVDETILTALQDGNAIIKGGHVNLNSVTISSKTLTNTLISDDLIFVDWVNYYSTNKSDYFTYAKSGDILSIAYSVEGNGGELQLIDTNNWQKYSDKYAVSGLSGTGTKDFIINEDLLVKLKAGNIVIKGAGNITGKGVSLKMFTTAAGYRPVYIPASGYATFYGENTCALPGGVKAYYVSSTTSESATLAELSNIPIGQGVILNGAKGIYQLYTTADAAASADDNMLEGKVTRQEITEPSGKYVLYNNGGTPEFRTITANTHLDAFKCYLNTSVSGGSKLNIVFAEDENKQGEEQQGETNSIRNIANTNVNSNVVYNMNGQRVGSDYKGLVIVNGKKIIKK